MIARIQLYAAAAASFVALAWFALFRAKRQGASDEKKKRAANDTAAYIEERKRQDAVEIGVGASDVARINRLRNIANGGR